jgi:hypothetical protein
MANRLRVVVLIHEFDDFANDGYLLSRVVQHWREAGNEVEIVRGIPSSPPAADVALLHANMTVVPAEYLELANRYPVVINGATTDISKRRVSQQILSATDDYAGPVIVKTDLNYGGRPELKQARQRGTPQTDPKDAHWNTVRSLTKYPILRSLRDVPAGVWQNPHLVVDKFTPERNAAGEFVLRIWIFLGDRSLHYSCISREPVIKSGTTLRREQLDRDDIPEHLRRRRRELGFDYGKFDYVQIDGQVQLLDANKTPGLGGRDAANSDNADKFRHLSEGLRHFLADKPSTAGEKVNPA